MVGLTWEPAMAAVRSASIVTMQMWIRSNIHRKPMMDHRRIWRTERIVLQSVKIGL